MRYKQTQAVPKETKKISKFTQQPFNFHKNKKTRAYATVRSKPTCIRRNRRGFHVYATVNQKPAYKKKRCIKPRQIDRLRQNSLESDSTRHTCPQTQHRNKRERVIQIH